MHAESDLIMALSNDFMQYQYKSQWCGQRVRVTNYGSNEAVIGGAGNSVVVTVADTCASCGFGDVDFSIGAWNMLTNSAPWGTFNAGWYVFPPPPPPLFFFRPILSLVTGSLFLVFINFRIPGPSAMGPVRLPFQHVEPRAGRRVRAVFRHN